MKSASSYYPIFADLHGRSCVVVGGGKIAERKVKSLLGYGARVTVISPDVTAGLARFVKAGRVKRIARAFQAKDVKRAWLVWSATDDSKVNETVFRQASRERVFTNVIDQQALCSFITPAIARRGRITAAISTGGASPTVAKHLRDEIGQVIGEGYPRIVRLFKGLRAPAKRCLPRYEDRQRYFEALMRGRTARLARAGDLRGARVAALRELKVCAANGV